MIVQNNPKKHWRIDRLIFLPVVFSLVLVGILFARATLIQRDAILERTKLQLDMMISTLADFTEFAEKTTSSSAIKNDAQRTAIWSALLRYPTAKIWVESKGKLISGQALTRNQDAYIITETDREKFIIHAALAKDGVLATWRKDAWEHFALSVFSAIGFLILTGFLSRALRQRGIAEESLKSAHAALSEHDALLKAVTQGATELLETRNYEEAIGNVLALIGKTVNVSWVHVNVIISKQVDKLHPSSIRYEWNDEAVPKLIDNIPFQNLNLAYEFSTRVESKQLDESSSFYTENLPFGSQEILQEFKINSFLYVPLIVENKLWGCLNFIDTAETKREWSWAETDTLKIFAGLISVTFSQMRYISELANANRRAGMAQIANDVLHNVGNVLNSVNVSAGLVVNNIKQSKVSELGKAVELMREHQSDLGSYISTDEHGKFLPEFISQLYENLLSQQEENLKELNRLLESIAHINDIVGRQQAYAGTTVIQEVLGMKELVEEGLRFCEDGYKTSHIKILREFSAVPTAKLDKHRVLQIIVNLLTNAKQACEESNQKIKQVILRLTASKTHVIFTVVDNGVGIPPENLEKIFNHGFTTRSKGHGFGLHNSFIAAKEMGGTLVVQSNGPNQGASFTLELPFIYIVK